MCGRYTLHTTWAELRRFLTLDPTYQPLTNRFNIAPTQEIFTYSLNGLETKRWGLPNPMGGILINARAETITQKRTFKDSFQNRRCIVPASGFYEWRKSDKQPFYITPTDGLFLFAGIWKEDKCAIITTAVNSVMSSLHDRMPVILSKDSVQAWLEKPVPELLKSCADDFLKTTPVSKRVNSVKNDDPACIEREAPNTLFEL